MASTMPVERRVFRALARAALLTALVAPALASPAVAATFETSVSPSPFSYPDTKQLVYRLHVTTGGQPERLQVSASAPSFPGGGTFMGLERMTLEGPGSVVGSGGGGGHGDRFCSPLLPDFHGSSLFFFPWIEVEIPANTTSTVALPGRPGSFAPWPGMDLGVEFRVGSQWSEIVRSPSPANSGRHGVEISFRTDPEGEPGGCPLLFTPVDLGREITMSGRADAAAAGHLMTIRAVRSAPQPGGNGFGNRVPEEGGPYDLATVRIAEDGTFAYRWRPTAPGDYTLAALYRSQSPKLDGDFSMPTNLRIVEPRTMPAVVSSARRVRCHRRRCTISVAGSIKPPKAAIARSRASEAASGCTGKVLMRVATRAGRLLTARVPVRSTCRYRTIRSFRLKARRARHVTVRVSYLGDALLLPRRGRAVRVKINRY